MVKIIYKIIVMSSVVLLTCFNAHAEVLKIGGTGGALGTMKILAEAYQQTHPETKFVILPSLGSGGGIKAVLAGAIQIAVSSRTLKPAEISQGANGYEYGRTPFVFVVSNNTKVDSITGEDLVEIYSGKRESWQDGTRIRLVLRPAGDSDSTIVKSISPEVKQAKTEAETRSGMLFAVTDQENTDLLEKIPGAFGASTLAQITAEQRSLKPLRLNGIEPSVRTVADSSYPYHKPLILVTSPKSPPAARQFIDFVNSPPGRDILSRVGFSLP